MANEKKVIDLSINGTPALNTLKDMEKRSRELRNILRNLNPNDERVKKYRAEFEQVNGQIAEARQQMGLVRKATKQVQQETASWKTMLSNLTKASGILFLADQLLKVVMAFGQLSAEAAKVQKEVSTLLGATGEEADKLTAKVLKITKTFGVDYVNVVKAANAATESFGVTGEEALDKLNTAMLIASGNGEEVLEVVNQYAPKMQEAGVAFDDFLAILLKGEQAGAQNLDVLADQFQEFNQRIREQTTATSDSLAPLGIAFRDNLFKGINDGTITSAQAFDRIVKRMDEVGISTKQAQTIIADTFGSQGEELTRDFLRRLVETGEGFDEIVAGADKSVKATLRLQQIQESFFESVSSAGGSIISFFYDLVLASDPIIKVFQDIGKEFSLAYQEIQDLIGGLGLFQKQGNLAKFVIDTIAKALTTPVMLIKAFAVGVRETAQAYQRFIANTKAAFTTANIVFKSIKEIALEELGGIGDFFVGIFTLDSSKVQQAIERMRSPVNDVKDIFKDAYTQEIAKFADTATDSIDKTTEAVDKQTKAVRNNTTATVDNLSSLKARAKASREALQEAELAAISDPIDRQIKELEIQAERRITALAGDPEQVKLKTEAINNELQIAIIKLKQTQKEGAKELEESAPTVNLFKVGTEGLQEQYDRQLLAEQNLLLRNIKAIQELEGITEEERAEKIALAKQETRMKQLEAEEMFYADQLELFRQFGDTQSIEYQQLQNKLLELTIDRQTKEAENVKKTNEIKKVSEQEAFAVSSSFLGAGLELLQVDEQARKKNAAAIKAFTIGKILADLASEIAGYNATPQNTFSLGTIGAIKAAIATARATAAIAQVSKQKFNRGGMLSGPSHAQGGIPGTGSFANVEVEGGEYIVNRKATAMNAGVLDTINRYGANMNFAIRKFQDGGVLQAPTISTSTIVNNNTAADTAAQTEQIQAGFNALSAQFANLTNTIQQMETQREVVLDVFSLEEFQSEINQTRVRPTA